MKRAHRHKYRPYGEITKLVSYLGWSPGRGIGELEAGKDLSDKFYVALLLRKSRISMPVILHKLTKYQVNPLTEILILGTFIPDLANAPDFFYGRERNFLWHLLPQCWGLDSLKDEPLSRKKEFMSAYNIGFADIIRSVDVPEGDELNTDDSFYDSHVFEWNDINALIDKLPNLKAVYFTKKTFNGVSRMRAQVKNIADHCVQKKIRFCKLETPSKFYSPEKLQQWIDTIVLQTSCLRV